MINKELFKEYCKLNGIKYSCYFGVKKLDIDTFYADFPEEFYPEFYK